MDAASSTIACTDGWASAPGLCDGIANSFWTVVVEPFFEDPATGVAATATTGFAEFGESVDTSRCAITIAGKTAFVGLVSDGINRMLTPSAADLLGSENETLVPVLGVADDVADDGAPLWEPGADEPVPTREPDCTVGKFGKLGSDGGKRGASTLGNGAIDCAAKLGAGVADAGLVATGLTTEALDGWNLSGAMSLRESTLLPRTAFTVTFALSLGNGVTAFEPGTMRIPTARTAGTRAISAGLVR